MNKENVILTNSVTKVSLFLVLMVVFSTAQGAIIQVPSIQPTIQAGIDAANPGDVVIVAPGTYSENLQISGKDITLQSSDPTNPAVVAATIIDGGSTGSVITLSGSESSACVIAGFTIQNGQNTRGAGIFATDAEATIECNVITNNTASGFFPSGSGGGISECAGIIRYNTITSNSAAGMGGGLYDCDGEIYGNLITLNSSSSIGGGLWGCDGIIRNNTISGNHASSGGGIGVCHGKIFNNLIIGNTAGSNGGGVYSSSGMMFNNTISDNAASGTGGGIHSYSGLISNSIIWGNTALSFGDQYYSIDFPMYCCIEGWSSGGPGNTGLDPLFVGSGDYHIAIGGSAYNTGSIYYLPNAFLVDLDENCRLRDGILDMGCYEYQSGSDEPDSDGDLLSDGDELIAGTSSSNPDHDGDGLYDGAEGVRGTSPSTFNAPTGLAVGSSDSIQEAMFKALEGEEITVATGTYNEVVLFLNKDAVLRSSDPLDLPTVQATILDVNAGSSCVYFSGDETAAAVLEGFTIQGASTAPSSVGTNDGIFGLGTGATIQNNIIRYHAGSGVRNCDGLIKDNTIAECKAVEYGGGVYECDGTIQGNTISNNLSTYGGGIGLSDAYITGNTINGNIAQSYGGGLMYCDGLIEKNDIYDNVAAFFGGGMAFCDGIIDGNDIYQNKSFVTAIAAGTGGGLAYCGYDDEVIIQNNLVHDNEAAVGGGLGHCTGYIQNNLVYGNTADDTTPGAYGGGMGMCEGIIRNNVVYNNTSSGAGGGVYIYTLPSSIVTTRFTNNIVYGNTGISYPQVYYANGDPDYCCIEGWIGGGTGNITDDPLFANAAGGDFTLQATSPCIDAGGAEYDLDFDIDGNPRPQDDLSVTDSGDGSTYDIGAYETAGTNLDVECWDKYR